MAYGIGLEVPVGRDTMLPTSPTLSPDVHGGVRGHHQLPDMEPATEELTVIDARIDNPSTPQGAPSLYSNDPTYQTVLILESPARLQSNLSATTFALVPLDRGAEMARVGRFSSDGRG